MPARVLRATGWLRRRTPADLPWYVLAFQTVIAVAVSPLPRRSLVAVVPHAVGLVAYWVVARLPGSERVLRGAVAGLAAPDRGLFRFCPPMFSRARCAARTRSSHEAI